MTFRIATSQAKCRAALLACILLCGLIAACGRNSDAAAKANALELTVLSPHGTDIRREFGEAFSKWHEAKYGVPVVVEWPDIGGGGTGNIIKTLNKAYQYHDTSGYDVVFGGGSAAMNGLATADGGKGFLMRPLPVAEGEEDTLAALPADIFGRPLREKNGLWVAATMSNFGIEVNKDRVAELGLKMPRVWEDIAGPEWIGRLSLADPAKSGSVKTSYEMIFQQYGWEKGWAVITRLFANAAMVREGGANPADDTGSADAVAGIVIDFYGRLAVLRAGESILTFVTPEGGTTPDPDPIAILKGAPHAELASRFVRFVVSPDGQRLWTHRAGTPGGPRRNTLGRLSVLPWLYEKESAFMFDPTSPFIAAATMGDASTREAREKEKNARDKYIGELIKAALIDNQPELAKARRAIHAAGDRPELLAMLTALPTFVPSSVNAKGELEYGSARTIDNASLGAVAEEFNPREKAKAGYAERLQNGLRDHWRETFAKRFADVERLARTK